MFIFSPHSDLLAEQLIYACDLSSGSSDLSEVRKFLDEGVHPNHSLYSREHNGFTPLHQACIHNHPDIVLILIERGADVNAVNSAGHTPLHYACEWGSLESIHVLLDHHCDTGECECEK